jgi:hypothetical protein
MLSHKNTLNTSADLNDSRALVRARTAGNRNRETSSHFSSLIYREDDDEEEIKRKLDEY